MSREGAAVLCDESWNRKCRCSGELLDVIVCARENAITIIQTQLHSLCCVSPHVLYTASVQYNRLLSKTHPVNRR